MAEFFDAMSEEIRAEGGTIERLVGDAIMADFGVPVAHEDDAERSVRAARRMLARLETWNAQRPPEQQIQIRIGINTGEVSTGGSFGEQLMVMGDAVNVAARLQEAAEPGTILVGERTERAVRRSFRLHEGRQITAKGKTGPLQAFVVEEELERPEEAGMLRAPIVGRSSELEMLRAAFDRARRERSPQFVTIVGDAGVGKSRLLEEFIATFEGEPKIVVGRCLPYGDGVTLAPLQEILRAEAGIFPQDVPDVSLKKVEELLRNVAEFPSTDVGSMSAALASTLGLSEVLESLADLDPRLVYREMVRAWRMLLGGLASTRPLVIAIEDMYWADQTTLDVLADLSEHLEGPVLFLCTARPDFVVSHSDWFSQLRDHSALRIDPLTSANSEALVTGLLGPEDLPEDLTQRVLARAEGNPLFIEEILLRLIDEGHLTEIDGVWQVTVDVSEIEVPERVQTLIQARLDLLSPREREVIQAAAVLGRHFWSGALERVTRLPDAQAIVDALKPRQMVVEQLTSSIPGEIEYAFRHLLIRDIAYESLPRKVRAEAHVAAAEWIESVRGARAEEAAELLADHYERAYEGLERVDLRVRARRYLLMAAQGSLRRFAITQAEYFGSRAVALSVSSEERIEALETLGDAFYLALRGDSAWRAYTAGLSELTQVPRTDNATVARLAAKAAIIPTRWVGALDAEVPAQEIQGVIEVGSRATGKSDSPERAVLLAAKAILRGSEGLTSGAEEDAREAVAIAERLRNPNLVSGAMDALAVLLWPTGRFGDIVRVDRARLDLIPNLSDVREIADVLLSTGRDLGKVGEFTEAAEYLDKAVDTVREIDVGQYLHVLVQRSQVRLMLGDWDGSIQDLAEIERLEHGAEGRIPPYAVRAYGVGFFCYSLRGHPAAAGYLEMLRRYRESTIDSWAEVSGPFTVPARALALRGEVQEALLWLSLDVSGFIRGEHLQALCDVIAVAGDWDRAPLIASAARAEAQRAEARVLDFFTDRLLGSMKTAAGELDKAAHHFNRSAEGFGGIGATWEEARSRMLAGEVWAQIGRQIEARADCESALATFKRLGSEAEHRRCVDLIEKLSG